MGNHERSSERSIDCILTEALTLFSTQGYGATSMRQIAAKAGLSVGNVYHHFGNKEMIFRLLLDQYWTRLKDPALPLNRLLASASFPDDLEQIAAAIEGVADENMPYILLIYDDVIEFQGKHIRNFYESMADRFAEAYGPSVEEGLQEDRFGDVNPAFAVIAVVRWFFYFFTVETCFGMPGHFGMDAKTATAEFIQLIRHGLPPRTGGEAPQGEFVSAEDA